MAIKNQLKQMAYYIEQAPPPVWFPFPSRATPNTHACKDARTHTHLHAVKTHTHTQTALAPHARARVCDASPCKSVNVRVRVRVRVPQLHCTSTTARVVHRPFGACGRAEHRAGEYPAVPVFR